MGRRDRRENRARPKRKGDYRRKQNTVSQRMLFIIACEGKCTEPNYFKTFLDMLIKEGVIASGSYVLVPHHSTDPPGVLNDLLKYRGCNSETYKDFDEKWIIIDRDKERTGGGGHTKEQYNDAIQRSKTKKISVAYSNPCFELWYLLHYDYLDAALDRDLIRTKLKPHMPDYAKSDKNHFIMLYDKMNTAIRNAKKLDIDKSCDDLTRAKKNPITTVYKLVEKLISYRD